MTEKEKMLAGELYDPFDLLLCAERQRARDLLHAFNETREAEHDKRAALIRELFGTEIDVWIQPPFFATTEQTYTLARRSFSTSTAWCWT